MSDLLVDIQNWYAANCDGYWEHQNGLRIETLDNPGWLVEIDVGSFRSHFEGFEVVKFDRSNDDWLRCELDGDKFKGFGGPGNLREILGIFMFWVKGSN